MVGPDKQDIDLPNRAIAAAAKKTGQKILDFRGRAPPAQMDRVETDAETPKDTDV